MDIDRYLISVDADGDPILEGCKDGDYVLWEDIQQMVKEYGLLHDFYDTVSKEADWTYRRLK
jgi:hypothetical protein